MKFIRFSINDENKSGLVEGDMVLELKEDFLVNKEEKTGKEYNLNEVKVKSPVHPGNIIAIGLNYIKHAEEVNKPLPDEPMMFMLSPSSIIGHEDIIKIPHLNHTTHFEAELVVVIGKEAKNIKKEEALEYVFGYTIGNDISDRDLQKKDVQYTRAKSFPTFNPMGPFIKTDINPNNLNVKLLLNGEVKQESNTNDLVFSVEELLEFVTEVITLNPGDIIMTGTPSGVDSIKPGDTIEIFIEEIGELINYVEKL